jgi:hypothetical protein
MEDGRGPNNESTLVHTICEKEKGAINKAIAPASNFFCAIYYMRIGALKPEVNCPVQQTINGEL